MKRRLDKDKYGSLTVVRYLGWIDGARTYLLKCRCGDHVKRTVPQLENPKLHRCNACAEERLELMRDKRREEKEKRTQHAYRQSAHQAWTKEEAVQVEGSCLAGLPPEAWNGHAGQGRQPQEAQLG